MVDPPARQAPRVVFEQQQIAGRSERRGAQSPALKRVRETCRGRRRKRCRNAGPALPVHVPGGDIDQGDFAAAVSASADRGEHPPVALHLERAHRAVEQVELAHPPQPRPAGFADDEPLPDGAGIVRREQRRATGEQPGLGEARRRRRQRGGIDNPAIFAVRERNEAELIIRRNKQHPARVPRQQDALDRRGQRVQFPARPGRIEPRNR